MAGNNRYVFGGWNNETQFNDLFLLDIEVKDWSVAFLMIAFHSGLN